jgi:hypothetical protein
MHRGRVWRVLYVEHSFDAKTINSVITGWFIAIVEQTEYRENQSESEERVLVLLEWRRTGRAQ